MGLVISELCYKVTILQRSYWNMTMNRLEYTLTLDLLESPADNFCKQFGPRSGPTKCRAPSESKLFYTLMIFLKEFFEKVDFEKSADDKKACKITLQAKC